MSKSKAKNKEFKEQAKLSGRRPCLCEASTHLLIGNCLNCGRIVCSLEGIGPCMTCGHHVYSMDQRQERMNELQAERKSQYEASKREQEKAQSVAGLKDIAASFEKAVNLKNKLLDYDQSSKAITKVIDDESDYFSLANEHWISNETRKDVKNQLEHIHANKNVKSKKLLLDFSNKHISEYEVSAIPDLEAALDQVEAKTRLTSDYEVVDTKSLEKEQLPVPRYCYQKKDTHKPPNTLKSLTSVLKKEEVFSNLRVQDSSLMEMSDEGICLTIQQPWASLLLHGIKLHEGRSWYTPYRGRLWIHAGLKEPSLEEIARAENIFRLIDESTKFPESYPTGYLLGYAYLKNCIPGEEYKIQYPNGYVDSPYIFIFEDPALLKLKIPMSGKMKLYKLEEQVFKAAAKQAVR